MSFEKAMELLSRDDKFKATVYAMNTLLIHKGIYTRDEFEKLFTEWASKQDINSIRSANHESQVSQ